MAEGLLHASFLSVLIREIRGLNNSGLLKACEPGKPIDLLGSGSWLAEAG
jgi:hypothetical protein